MTDRNSNKNKLKNTRICTTKCVHNSENKIHKTFKNILEFYHLKCISVNISVLWNMQKSK